MLNTFIENRGITQTIVRKNNKNSMNEINWNANYNGDTANISVNSNTDGAKKHYDISLDNYDLASLLNLPSVNIPIHKRLKMDFDTPIHITPLMQNYSSSHDSLPSSLSSPQYSSPLPQNYLSSPSSNEEFIVPITINNSKKRRPKRKKTKTHKTYKVYKKYKSNRKTHSKRHTL
jgi:hypothetical protein